MQDYEHKPLGLHTVPTLFFFVILRPKVDKCKNIILTLGLVGVSYQNLFASRAVVRASKICKSHTRPLILESLRLRPECWSLRTTTTKKLFGSL